MSTTPPGTASSSGAANAINPNAGKKAVHVKVRVDSCFVKMWIVDVLLGFPFQFRFEMSVMVIFVRTKHTSQKGHGITLVIVTAKTWSVLRTFPSFLSMLVPFLHDPFFWFTTVVRIFFRRDILCSSLPRGVFACYCYLLAA
jgi:hypothetical protein